MASRKVPRAYGGGTYLKKYCPIVDRVGYLLALVLYTFFVVFFFVKWPATRNIGRWNRSLWPFELRWLQFSHPSKCTIVNGSKSHFSPIFGCCRISMDDVLYHSFHVWLMRFSPPGNRKRPYVAFSRGSMYSARTDETCQRVPEISTFVSTDKTFWCSIEPSNFRLFSTFALYRSCWFASITLALRSSVRKIYRIFPSKEEMR